MKVHIVSLQRTGSKSLQNAIHAALDVPLEFRHHTHREHLGEFFHLWPLSGYKFGWGANHPFDPDAPILFRTAPEYAAFRGANFLPVPNMRNFLGWTEHRHVEKLTASHIHYMRVLLDAFPTRDYVVKTQLATLCEDVQDVVRSWLPQVIEGFDLTINLEPTDVVKWLCSNYACDMTGIFAPCDAQDKARESIKLTMPLEYVQNLMERLNLHRSLVAHIPNVMTISTESLSDPATVAALASRLGVSFGSLAIRHPKEFSASGYEKLFTNYSDIAGMIESTSPKLHAYASGLTYPLG